MLAALGGEAITLVLAVLLFGVGLLASGPVEIRDPRALLANWGEGFSLEDLPRIDGVEMEWDAERSRFRGRLKGLADNSGLREQYRIDDVWVNLRPQLSLKAPLQIEDITLSGLHVDTTATGPVSEKPQPVNPEAFVDLLRKNGLQTVTLEDARFVYQTENGLERLNGDIKGRLQASDGWQLSFDLERSADRGRAGPGTMLLKGTANVAKNLAKGRLALNVTSDEMSGHIDARLEQRDALKGLVGFDATARDFSFTNKEAQVFSAQSAKLTGTFDTSSSGLRLSHVDIAGLNVRDAAQKTLASFAAFSAKASISLAAEGAGGGHVRLEDVAVIDGFLPFEDIYEEPLRLETLRSPQVDFYPGESRLVVPELVLRSRGVDAAGSADLRFRPEGWVGDTAIHFPSVPLETAPVLWPATVAPNIRKWCAKNLPTGTAEDLKIALTYDPEAEDGVSEFELKFNFRDMTIRYLPEMSPLVGAEGTSRITLDRLDVHARSGRLLVEGKPIELHDSWFRISDFLDPYLMSTTDLNVKGDAGAIMALIDQKPLHLARQAELKPGDFSGMLTGTARFALPMKRWRDNLVDIIVEARGTDLRGRAAGQDIFAKAAALTLTDEGIDIEGKGAVSGIEGHYIFEQNFTASTEVSEGRITLDITIPGEHAQPPAGQQVLRVAGPLPLQAVLTLEDGEITGAEGRVSLENAALSLAELGWKKPAGPVSILEFKARKIPGDGYEIPAFALNGEDHSLSGAARLSPKFAPLYLDIANAKLGDRYAGRGVINLQNPARPEISLVADFVDLEPLFESHSMMQGTQEATEEIILDIAAREARVSKTRFVQNLQAATLLRGGAVRVEGRGAFNGAAPFVFVMREDEKGRILQIESSDAGALGEVFGVFDQAEGGRLRLDMLYGPSKRKAEGTLKMSDLVIHEMPGSLRFLNAISVIGLFDEIATGGTSFNAVDMAFTKAGPHYNVSEATAIGPSIGMTLNGSYDSKGRDMNMRGSVSPAFVINGLLSDVPVVGDLLTGGKGKGVLGVAFQMRGKDSNPTISVNPLSAFTPGLFRNIFTETYDTPATTSGGAPAAAEATESDGELQE